MSYQAALEAAGAEVLAFEHFGSYQGDWIAEVKYRGEHGFVCGSYGSCSGCDSFEAEFGYYDEENDPKYQERLKQFGLNYVDPLLPYEKVLADMSENLDWDYDAREAVAWLEARMEERLKRLADENIAANDARFEELRKRESSDPDPTMLPPQV